MKTTGKEMKEQAALKAAKGRHTERLLERLNQIPLAEEQPIRVYDKPVSGFKAIVDPTEKEVLSVVSKDYQLVQHQAVYRLVESISTLRITEARLFRRGRSMMIEAVPVKEQTIEILPKDRFQPYIRVFNSYDKTRALSIQAYSIRLVCKNGAIAPVRVGNYYKAHMFQNIDMTTVKDFMSTVLAAWTQSAEILRASAKKTVDVDKALSTIGRFPTKYRQMVYEHLHVEPEKEQHAILYDVWNALTYVITHQMKPNVSTNILLKHQRRANNVFNLLKDPQAAREAPWRRNEPLPPTEHTQAAAAPPPAPAPQAASVPATPRKTKARKQTTAEQHQAEEQQRKKEILQRMNQIAKDRRKEHA